MKIKSLVIFIFLSITNGVLAFECARPTSQDEIDSYQTIFWGEVISGPLSSIQFIKIFAALESPEARRYYDHWRAYKTIAGNSYTIRVKGSYQGHFRVEDIAVLNLPDLSNFLGEKDYLIFSNETSNEFELNGCYAVPLTKSKVDHLKNTGERLKFEDLKSHKMLPGYRSLRES